MFLCQIAMPDFPGEIKKCVCSACKKEEEHRVSFSLNSRPKGWAVIRVRDDGEDEYLICDKCARSLLHKRKLTFVSHNKACCPKVGLGPNNKMSDRSVALLPMPGKAKRKRRYRGNDAYGVLGVPPDTPFDEVKRTYRRLVRRCHPDLNPSPEARQEFVRLTRAYNYIEKHGDLVRLQMKCEVVEAKVEYVDFLWVHKRAKDFAGIESDPPFNPGYNRRDEYSQKMEKLGKFQEFRCPVCRWRGDCDRATGFNQVKDMHNELRGKTMAKMVEMMFDSLNRRG